MQTSIHDIFNMGDNETNDVNTFHHSNHFIRLICYSGHLDGSICVAICMRSFCGVMPIKQAHAAKN